MVAATTAEVLALAQTNVVVHPLVLLSVVDHYNRTCISGKKRVVGVLLGQNQVSHINVANSFAVPFEEDEHDPSVWFLDHNYVEGMTDMFKKINAREKLIGWYHSGPKLRSSDLLINELFKKYTNNPVLVIVDVNPSSVAAIPTHAYFSVDEIKDDGSSTEKTFVHVASTIDAEEAEEIGVEHLLRDIKDSAVGNLASKVTRQLRSLQGLHHRLQEIVQYLQMVLDGKLPQSHTILETLQDVFNLLPNLSNLSSSKSGEMEGTNILDVPRAFRINLNDQLMCTYLSSLIRAIIAMEDLIDPMNQAN